MLRYREKCRQDHYRKLGKLTEVENVKNLTRAQQNQIAKIKQMRLQVNQFNQAEKNMEINKHN